ALARPTGRLGNRSAHRGGDGHRPEPAQIVGTAACFVDAADLPLAGNDGVVRAVFVGCYRNSWETSSVSRRGNYGDRAALPDLGSMVQRVMRVRRLGTLKASLHR